MLKVILSDSNEHSNTPECPSHPELLVPHLRESRSRPEMLPLYLYDYGVTKAFTNLGHSGHASTPLCMTPRFSVMLQKYSSGLFHIIPVPKSWQSHTKRWIKLHQILSKDAPDSLTSKKLSLQKTFEYDILLYRNNSANFIHGI
jgi:hypothetical protein